MTHVFLHVGGHKTGTSFLQGLFHRNRALLADAGLDYPDIGPNSGHHLLAGAWLDMPDMRPFFSRTVTPASLWADVTARHADGQRSLLLSSESFSRIKPEKVDMADLAARVRAIGEVRVIYVMRAQAELAQSIWTQVAKTRTPPSCHSYVQKALTKRLCAGVLIDHQMFYDHLLTGFAPEEILLADYAQMRRHPGGIAQAMLDLMDVPCDASAMTLPPQDSYNVSPDPLALYVASRIETGRVPSAALVDMIARALAKHHEGPTTFMAQHEYAKFWSRYAPGNAQLVERVQRVQKGFTFEEHDAPENMLYRRDLPEQFWIDLLTAFYYQGGKPADGSKLTETLQNWLRPS